LKRVLSWMILALVAAGSPVGAHADEMKHKIWGDFRGRYEGFWYGIDAPGKAAQLSTGGTDNRSGNQTLGSPVDFGANSFDLRRAFMIVNPFADGKLPQGDGSWVIEFGRTPNPFLWDEGKDLMLWDGDINLTGVTTMFENEWRSETKLFAHAAYAVIDENSGAKDPFMLAGQVGLKQEVASKSDVGARVSFYDFDNLDGDFIGRGVDGSGGVTAAGGNIADGLTGDPNGGKVQVIEVQGFLSAKPASFTAYGGYSNNLSAEAPASATTYGKENRAFNVGAQIGSSKRSYGQVGFMYVWIEANAFPSQYIDSDLLDGYTNRKGGFFYYARSVAKNVGFNAQVFSSDVVEADVPVRANSVAKSKRVRGQADITFKF
jgi:hypothetical protein